MYSYTDEELQEFIRESNAIEGEYSDQAITSAMEAWNYGIAAITHNGGYVGVADILVLHHLLMKNIRRDISGKFRECSVIVGGRICPPWWIVHDLVTEWVDRYQRIDYTKIHCAHIEFEHIHPFIDGNGRVGRIIMNLQRVYNDMPLLIIHTGEEQQEYYKWFV
ncbi:MAG: Fic family protein [Nitrosopumilus sp.]|nr:Fic family protein [Nitrosopumilus sp.]